VGDRATDVRDITIPGDTRDAGWAGNTLLAPGAGIGGGGSHMYRSGDSGATWTDLTKTITGAEPTDQGVSLDTPYFSPVISLGDGTAVVLEETITNAGVSAKALRFAQDGTWTEVASFLVAGDFGGGPGGVTATAYGTDAIIVPGIDGTTFQVVAMDGTVSTITAVGLPVAPNGLSLSFQDASNGLAQVTVSGCANDKTNCASTTTIYATTDGGRSWSGV